MAARLKWSAGLAMILALVGCSPSRLVESARLGVAAGAGPALDPAVPRMDVRLAGIAGDLYRPPSPQAALVMVPGVTPEGRDDPRLIAFAGTLAAHGFLVFVPELPGLRAQRVGRDDPDAIAAAVAALASCFAPGPPAKLALAAISYAVAPALVATTLPGGREHVALILGIGGYHRASAAIAYLTTGFFRPAPAKPWQRGTVLPAAKWVFVLASALQLPEPEDRRLLSGIARTMLADPAADLPDTAAGLGPGGRAMLALATNEDPDRVPLLLAELPPSVRADLAYLDPARLSYADFPARLLLVHGRDDPLIPAIESTALAEALPAGQADVFVVGNLGHVDISPGGAADTMLLWQAAYRLLELRDMLNSPDPTYCDLAAAPPP